LPDGQHVEHEIVEVETGGRLLKMIVIITGIIHTIAFCRGSVTVILFWKNIVTPIASARPLNAVMPRKGWRRAD